MPKRWWKTHYPNRCPVSKAIYKWHVVQGAVDNFDHTENTVAGKDSTHDTVLVIFQNKPRNNDTEGIQMTSCSTPPGRRKFAKVLPCQVLEKSHLVKGTGDIPESFSPTLYSDKLKNSVDDDYFLWCMARLKYSDPEDSSFPSFTATMSAPPCPKSCMSAKSCTCRGKNIKCVTFCSCIKDKCRNPNN